MGLQFVLKSDACGVAVFLEWTRRSRSRENKLFIYFLLY